MKEPNYEDETYDINEMEFTDLKINPSYYLHSAILKAQQALIKDNFEAGVTQYLIMIEHLEIVAKASKSTPENYDTQIQEFKKDIKAPKDLLISNKEHFAFLIKIAHKKLEIILGGMFSSTTITDPLPLGKK